jgi:hypothetical protein
MTSENPSRKLGSAGPTVFPLALGSMGMSGMASRKTTKASRPFTPRSTVSEERVSENDPQLITKRFDHSVKALAENRSKKSTESRS